MLAAALEEEVSTFLGRDRYERGEEFRGYRNGYHPSRELTVGVSAVEVKVAKGIRRACGSIAWGLRVEDSEAIRENQPSDA